jgi:hypothetical protein
MPDNLQTSSHTLANRFRLGVTLAAVLACLLGVGLLLKNRWQVAWDEAEQARSAGQLKRTTRAQTHYYTVQLPKPAIPATARASSPATPPVTTPSEELVLPMADEAALPVTATATVQPARPANSGRVAAPTVFGSITGQVLLSGTPPPEAQLPFDPMCGRLWTNGPPTIGWYKLSSEGGLAEVFVYLSAGVPKRRYPLPEEPLVIDQRGCLFTPYVAGAQVCQTIRVLNSDPVLHNVHPTPTVPGNRETNRAQLPKGAPLDHLFAEPEVFVRFKCDVHPWMFAYVGVVEHPFFAVTDTNGVFTIPNVPPGRYTLQAVHRKTHPTGKGLTVDIVVEADAETPVVFEVNINNSGRTASR